MPLLNFSTKVPANTTIAEIQKKLIEYGVREVTIRYDNGKPIGVAFRIETSFGDREVASPRSGCAGRSSASISGRST